jgi:hypothetical protein
MPSPAMRLTYRWTKISTTRMAPEIRMNSHATISKLLRELVVRE